MKLSTRLFLAAAVVVVMGLVVGATVAAENGVRIELVPPEKVSPISGEALYAAHCAVCHGPEGRGDGAVARLLIPAPTDLTALCGTHSVGFPRTHVAATIARGHVTSPATSVMPEFGHLFSTVIDVRNPSLADLRVRNLVDYLESIQDERPLAASHGR